MSFIGATFGGRKQSAPVNGREVKRLRTTHEDDGDSVGVDNPSLRDILRRSPPPMCMDQELLRGFEYVEANVHASAPGAVVFALRSSELPERAAELEQRHRPMLDRLEVRVIEGNQRGVYARQDIPTGTFVCEYVGQYLPEADLLRTDSEYIFTFKPPYKYALDAERYGNVGRFINHSHTHPNLVVAFDNRSNELMREYAEETDESRRAAVRARAGLTLPRLFFYSIEPVKKGKQLLFDYGANFVFDKVAVTDLDNK